MKTACIITTAVLVMLASARAEDVQGQVFIVTNGHETIKLALVPVFALDAESVRRVCDEFGKSATVEGNDFIDSIEKPIRDLSARADARHHALAKRLPNSAEYAASFNLAKRCSDLEHDAFAYIAFLISSNRLFGRLPPPLTSTKTDADGNFAITVADRRQAVLGAVTTRKVFNKTESYHWLVPLDGTSGKVMLSNDNLTSAYPAGSPFHWEEADQSPPSIGELKERLAKLNAAVGK